MTAKEWIEKTYTVVNHDLMGQVIVWGNQIGFYGIYTPVEKFLEMYEDVIQTALDLEEEVKPALRESDPNNMRGFNEII
ncbi:MULTISPECIES: hypothetical protein [Paenibacillus]|uniref:hypothetical protein n=1 Tax=Paenibacillus TaxID=44249 RepID=UPI00119EE925|nr:MULTISPECIES: hypothetical protein [Paenibacillus]